MAFTRRILYNWEKFKEWIQGLITTHNSSSTAHQTVINNAISTHNSSTDAHSAGFNHAVIVTSGSAGEPELRFKHNVSNNITDAARGFITWMSSDNKTLAYMDLDTDRSDTVYGNRLDIQLNNPDNFSNTSVPNIASFYNNYTVSGAVRSKGLDLHNNDLVNVYVRNTPTNNFHIANKKYVDDSISGLNSAINAKASIVQLNTLSDRVSDHINDTEIHGSPEEICANTSKGVLLTPKAQAWTESTWNISLSEPYTNFKYLRVDFVSGDRIGETRILTVPLFHNLMTTTHKNRNTSTSANMSSSYMSGRYVLAIIGNSHWSIYTNNSDVDSWKGSSYRSTTSLLRYQSRNNLCVVGIWGFQRVAHVQQKAAVFGICANGEWGYASVSSTPVSGNKVKVVLTRQGSFMVQVPKALRPCTLTMKITTNYTADATKFVCGKSNTWQVTKNHDGWTGKSFTGGENNVTSLTKSGSTYTATYSLTTVTDNDYVGIWCDEGYGSTNTIELSLVYNRVTWKYKQELASLFTDAGYDSYSQKSDSTGVWFTE